MTDETSFDQMKKRNKVNNAYLCVVFYSVSFSLLPDFPICTVISSAWFPFCVVFPSAWFSRLRGFPICVVFLKNTRQILGAREFGGPGSGPWKKEGKKERRKKRK